MTSVFSDRHFHNEDAAYAYVEARVWPNGPVCPHCGMPIGAIRYAGQNHPLGLHKCYACRKPFTVKVGTIFEAPRPAAPLAASHPSDVRVQEGHQRQPASPHPWRHPENRVVHGPSHPRGHAVGGLAPMGGEGGVVEIDETYIGKKEGAEVRRGDWHKKAVLTLVERGGSARSFVVDTATKEEVIPIIRENLAREIHVMTDEANRYSKLGSEFSKHDAVDHSRGEYGYTDRESGVKINTNTVRAITRFSSAA